MSSTGASVSGALQLVEVVSETNWWHVLASIGGGCVVGFAGALLCVDLYLLCFKKLRKPFFCALTVSAAMAIIAWGCVILEQYTGPNCQNWWQHLSGSTYQLGQKQY
jgi:hypothetical protein